MNRPASQIVSFLSSKVGMILDYFPFDLGMVFECLE
jgi:hypothetical protein